MDRPKSIAAYAKRASRRFTSLEGWKEVGNTVYSAAGTGLRIITIDPEFDPARYYDDNPAPTRLAKSEWSNSSIHSTSRLYSRYEGRQSGNGGVPGTPQSDGWRKSGLTEGSSGDWKEYPPWQDMVAEDQKLPPPPVAEQPYHVFTKSQTWLLIITIGVAGLFSGLSSNIYFPSLDIIAQDLNVSLGAVSLTITSYLIIQGISPVIWGSFADTVGRRPIYIASFTVYIIANIALSFSPNFAVLLIFRGLQAAGSASTVSIGNGVIQDISAPAERGAYISFYQAIRNFSIAIGPVLGGALANSLGFRSIFVFLLILSSIVLIVIIIFLPETLRSIAGNGSLRLTGIHQPLIRRIREPPNLQDPDDTVVRKKVTIMAFIDPLKLLAEKDILSSLVFGGVVYAIWSMVTASTTGLFKSRFGLNELLLGLAFLPNGFGTIVGSAIIGKLMTHDFKAAETAYKIAHNLPPTHKLPAKNVPPDFPIEHARLHHLPWIIAVFAVSTAFYGFSLAFPVVVSRPGWIAVPLALQFVIAATSNAVFALNQTLVSDLCPGMGASSTAINNLVRCGLGAVGVAFIDGLIAAVGPGPAFLGLALITVACTPLAVVNWYFGVDWRRTRIEKKARLADEKMKLQGA